MAPYTTIGKTPGNNDSWGVFHHTVNGPFRAGWVTPIRHGEHRDQWVCGAGNFPVPGQPLTAGYFGSLEAAHQAVRAEIARRSTLFQPSKTR